MIGRSWLLTIGLCGTLIPSTDAAEPLRAGIIGCDTSHVVAFTTLINAPEATGPAADVEIVAAYPGGSDDLPASRNRLDGFVKKLRQANVEIVDSIDDLLGKVDVVLLESVDGRKHLEQAKPVFASGKPVFIDKPLAASLADCVAIFEAAKKYDVPVFSSSALRFGKNTQLARGGQIGTVMRCRTTSPASLEKTHPDLFWYGIHLSDDSLISQSLRRYETWNSINHQNPERRIAVRTQLAQAPGRHLVFVRYSPRHIFQDEWVYNAADIDSSRVVWARDLGSEENEKLRRYFPGRTVWLLETDFPQPKLAPYVSAPPPFTPGVNPFLPIPRAH